MNYHALRDVNFDVQHQMNCAHALPPAPAVRTRSGALRQTPAAFCERPTTGEALPVFAKRASRACGAAHTLRRIRAAECGASPSRRKKSLCRKLQRDFSYYNSELHTLSIAQAKIFAFKSKLSMVINSSAPCIWLSSPGNSAPNATPPSV